MCPVAAQRARYRYSCFDHFSENTQAYGYAAAFGMSKTREDDVVNQLVELTRRAPRAGLRRPTSGFLLRRGPLPWGVVVLSGEATEY